MNGILLHIDGNWAHFKKPETNNNPLSHDFITKTALIGLMGAVLGVEREDMKALFPQLSEDLLYGVCIEGAVKKESWAFTLRKASNLFEKAPKQMEFLRNPKFTVALAVADARSLELFEKFAAAIEKEESHFTPVLGLHNCPANLMLVSRGIFTQKSGAFETKGFITNKLSIDVTKGFRVGFERIPTYQNDDFWNLPEKYVEVLYPSEDKSLSVKEGEYFEFSTDASKWILL